jgi:hypothetical protein
MTEGTPVCNCYLKMDQEVERGERQIVPWPLLLLLCCCDRVAWGEDASKPGTRQMLFSRWFALAAFG